SSSDEENKQENEGSQNGEKFESDKEVDKVFESSCMQGDALFYDNDNKKRRRIEIPPGFTPKETSVNEKNERYGSVFNVQSDAAFNNFISLASLIDLPLDGDAYTWVHKSATKMRKLDQCLISKGLMASFPHLSAICLDKHLSDHRPNLMRVTNIDSGLTPFRFFHSWFQIEGFDKLVEDTWMHMGITDSNGMILLKKKLQSLKIIIREWTINAKKCSYKKKSSIQSKLSDIDKIIEQDVSNEVILNDRSILLKKLHDIISLYLEKMAQKAKVCWAIEGDENSKYFHGILNNKRSHLAIRGVLVNGDWIVKPNDLSLEQQDDLGRTVYIKKIKRPVWDCGTNKSPGLDGFTFEFFQRYWKFLENDISVAVIEFFSSGTFPKGCNSSFIVLIPKT
nr:RNA-directed DNA polymerase, eukaryota [Tanacetum cinerariifolium]